MRAWVCLSTREKEILRAGVEAYQLAHINAYSFEDCLFAGSGK
jgi:hypothetical protein